MWCRDPCRRVCVHVPLPTFNAFHTFHTFHTFHALVLFPPLKRRPFEEPHAWFIPYVLTLVVCVGLKTDESEGTYESEGKYESEGGDLT